MSEWEPTRPDHDPARPGPTAGDGVPGAAGDLPMDSPAGTGELVDPAAPAEPWYRQRGPLVAVTGVAVAVAFLLIALVVWAVGGDDDRLATTDDTTTTAATVPPTEPPVTEPPVTQPPVTEPPVTESPVTEPPVTEPPVTEPPVTEPPATQPPATTTPTTEAPATTSVPVVTVPPGPDATVWDVIRSSPDLSRMRELLEFTELDDVVSGSTPFTLLTPSDDAWELFELSPGGADLLADQGRATDLVLRHLIFTEVFTADELFGEEVVLVANGDVLTVDGAARTVDGARLLVSDVAGSNGMLHVVERVLVP